MNDTINISQLRSDATSSLASQLTQSAHLIIESNYDYHHAQLDDLLDLMMRALVCVLPDLDNPHLLYL